MSNRTCQVRYSKDGGKNWSGFVERTLGEVGDFEQRVKLRRLGKGRQWVFDIRVTSPIAAHLMAASTQLEGSDS